MSKPASSEQNHTAGDGSIMGPLELNYFFKINKKSKILNLTLGTLNAI